MADCLWSSRFDREWIGAVSINSTRPLVGNILPFGIDYDSDLKGAF